jgi:AcrR family transcriptional regulator
VLAPATGDTEALEVSGLSPAPAAIPAPPPADDGQRIALAFAELVAERGYPAATLTEAARRAGVDPALAGEHFDDEADCTLRTVESWTDRTFSAMAASFASAPRDWALAVHRALGAMLAQMAAEPAMLLLTIGAIEQLGSGVVARRSRSADVFFDAIASAADPADPPSTTARRVSETLVYAVLRRYAAEARIAELPAALPEVSYLCVAPFFGPQRAADVSQLPFAAAG